MLPSGWRFHLPKGSTNGYRLCFIPLAFKTNYLHDDGVSDVNIVLYLWLMYYVFVFDYSL